MNYIKMINRCFDFLKSYGFSKKKFSRSADYEIYYFKKNIEIEIFFGLSIPNDVVIDKNTSNEKILDMSTYAVSVSISSNNHRLNILESDLFSEEKIASLKTDLYICGDLVEAQITIYSEFIRENINSLI